MQKLGISFKPQVLNNMQNCWCAKANGLAVLFNGLITTSRRNRLFLALGILLVVPLSSAQSYNSGEDPFDLRRVISVSGQASTTATPDTFSMQFGFSDKGANLGLIKKKVDKNVKDAIRFLVSQGVTEDSIESMQISVYPWQERANIETVQKGFVYNRTIVFSHKKLDDFDGIIQGIAELNPTNIGSFVLSVSNKTAIIEKLTDKALVNAQTKAKRMANALNMEVIGVTQINETALSDGPIIQRNRAYSLAQEGTSLPGEQIMQASVAVTFEIAPKFK